jgi:peptide/nickel transport system substrate-binding protein
MLHGFMRVLGIGLFLCVACGLVGCKKGPDSHSSATSRVTADPPLIADCEPGKPGGRLVIATVGDPKTFNPIVENESTSQQVLRFLFVGLTGFDWRTQTALPSLAESWKVDSDGKSWTFKLRRNLRWSDGHPLTADDVVFTWNDIVYNTNIVNVIVDLFRIDGKDFKVSKVDDTTVRIVTPEVYAPFEEYVGSVLIMPKHILAEPVAKKQFESAYGINTPAEKLVCNGPFRLKDYKPGQHTILERNPNYFSVDKKGQPIPYLDTVVLSVVPNLDAMALRFLSGQSDVHELVRPDEIDRFKEESSRGKFQVYELGVGLERHFLWFNQNTNINTRTGKPYVDPRKLKWFRNTKFRQAIANAIDRPSIIKSVYAGRAKLPSSGFATEANQKWLNKNVPLIPYDPAKARALLAETGIQDRDGDGFLEDADGNVIEFVLNTNTGNSLREKVAVLLQEDLKRLGIRLTYQPIEFNALAAKIQSTYDYEAVLGGLGGGGVDPASSMNVLKSDGFTHWWFPRQTKPSTAWEARIDFLMNAQIKTINFEERKKYFDEVQEIMAREMPFVYTVAPLNYSAIRSDIHNLKPTVLSYYRLTWNAEELYFSK